MNEDSLRKLLQKHFSYDNFRTGQLEIIQSILQQQDTLAVLPTGTGKSICYQLPALVQKGPTVIVSPLISLMFDQVKELKAMQKKRVVAITSFMNHKEREDVFSKIDFYQMIFISPELLQQKKILSMLTSLDISLFVIDEAHCISQWGHAFRPDYLRLEHVIKTLKNPPVLALSATAPPQVLKDIEGALNRPGMKRFIYPMDRTNIGLFVQHVQTEEEKKELLEKVTSLYDVPTLIYFSSRIQAEKIATFLSEVLPNRHVAYYHGELEQSDRIIVQQQFMNDQLDIICCTSAFGMGINKANIRLVIHYHYPGQLEPFIQEFGRAGRDGNQSISLVLYAPYDASLPAFFIEQELPNEEVIDAVLNEIQTGKWQTFHEKTKNELKGIYDINEVQWRFLLYQLEIHGMMRRSTFQSVENLDEVGQSIKHKRLSRLTEQWENKNIADAWVYARGCLREKLYTNFQKNYEHVHSYCCSNCHSGITDWNLLSINKKDQQNQPWNLKLQKLLNVGGFNEAK